MANSADPDQLISSEANWSGSTLFAKAGHIWVQQDKGFKKKDQIGLFKWCLCDDIFSDFLYKSIWIASISLSKHMLLVLIWIASTCSGSSNEDHQHNIAFIKSR